MRLKHDLIVLDLEINPSTGSVIEIGAVKLSRTGALQRSGFSRLINPYEPMGTCTVRGKGTISILELIGRTQDEIDNGTTLNQAMKEFYEWSTDHSKNIVLAGWGGDAYWLRADCIDKGVDFPFRNKSFDIKSMVVFYSSLVGMKFKTDGLRSVMKVWGLKFDGIQHQAESDAYNTARLLQTCICHHYKVATLTQKVTKMLTDFRQGVNQ